MQTASDTNPLIVIILTALLVIGVLIGSAATHQGAGGDLVASEFSIL